MTEVRGDSWQVPLAPAARLRARGLGVGLPGLLDVFCSQTVNTRIPSTPRNFDVPHTPGATEPPRNPQNSEPAPNLRARRCERIARARVLD